MNIEDYKLLQEAMVIPSQGTGSPFRNLLVKMFNAIVQLERATTRARTSFFVMTRTVVKRIVTGQKEYLHR